MDIEVLAALIGSVVSLLGFLGTAIGVFIRLGIYKEKIDSLERALEGILTHEQLSEKLLNLRNILDKNISELHEKVNKLRDEAANNNRVEGLDVRLSELRTDIEVLKEGVGRAVDTMSSIEGAITSLLTESRGDEVRLKTLEYFRNEANDKIRQLELQLARMGDK